MFMQGEWTQWITWLRRIVGVLGGLEEEHWMLENVPQIVFYNNMTHKADLHNIDFCVA
jgi:hypothetical protein